MYKDSIVEQVRRIKEAHAARYGYDVKAMAIALRESQHKAGHKVVTLPAKRPQASIAN